MQYHFAIAKHYWNARCLPYWLCKLITAWFLQLFVTELVRSVCSTPSWVLLLKFQAKCRTQDESWGVFQDHGRAHLIAHLMTIRSSQDPHLPEISILVLKHLLDLHEILLLENELYCRRNFLFWDNHHPTPTLALKACYSSIFPILAKVRLWPHPFQLSVSCHQKERCTILLQLFSFLICQTSCMQAKILHKRPLTRLLRTVCSRNSRMPVKHYVSIIRFWLEEFGLIRNHCIAELSSNSH